VLAAFFNWLLQEERLQDAPMKRVPKPKRAQEQIKPLTPEELARLLAQPDRKTVIGLRDDAFIALLADTGLRVSEAVRMWMADVDERLHSVTVVGKGEEPRTVFYGEAVGALLKSYLRRRRSAPARRPRPRENYPDYESRLASEKPGRPISASRPWTEGRARAILSSVSSWSSSGLSAMTICTRSWLSSYSSENFPPAGSPTRSVRCQFCVSPNSSM
jgi:integrase